MEQLKGQEKGGKDLPLKSAGTRNFFLSMSGMLDLGTFSTITWREGRERQTKREGEKGRERGRERERQEEYVETFAVKAHSRYVYIYIL